jgi:hypothetical protein
MNLNHIAKKPFFDLFYRTPCMALLLRTAFHDAGTYSADARSGYAILFQFLISLIVDLEEV